MKKLTLLLFPLIALAQTPSPEIFLRHCITGMIAFDEMALLPSTTYFSSTANLKKQKSLMVGPPIRVEINPEDYTKPAPADRMALVTRKGAEAVQASGSVPYSEAEIKTLNLNKGDTVKIGGKEFVLGEFLYADYGAHVYRLASDPTRAVALPFRSGDYHLNPSLPVFAAPKNLDHHKYLQSTLTYLESAGIKLPRIKIHETEPNGQYAILDAQDGETALEFVVGVNQKYGYSTQPLGPMTVAETWRALSDTKRADISSAYHKQRAGSLRDKVRDTPDDIKYQKLSALQIRMANLIPKIRDQQKEQMAKAGGDATKKAEIKDHFDSLIYNLDISVPFQFRNLRWDSKTQDWVFTSWYAP